MTTGRMSALAAALHRALLVSYPRTFRERFAADMQQLFETRLTERARSGRWRAAAFAAFALADLLATGLSTRIGGHGFRTLTLIGVTQDLRQSARMLARTPFLSLTSVAALAIGLALAITGFTVVNAVFFGAFPAPYGERIVAIQDYNREGGWDISIDLAEFERRRDVLKSFDHVGAYHARKVRAGDEIVRAAFITPNTFDLIGVPPSSGRLLIASDTAPGSRPVVLVAESLAGRWFGTASAAIGKVVRIDDVAREVVGVIPAACRFPVSQLLWMPLGPDAPTSARQTVTMFGRLREGISADTAAPEIDVLAAQNPNRPRGVTMEGRVVPFARANAGSAERYIAISVVAGIVLLLVVFAGNVANLILARTAARRRELAVRTALGASRGQLVRQLAFEVLALAFVAALIGLAITTFTLTWVSANVSNVEYWTSLRPNAGVIAWTLGLTAVVTLVSGVLPAIRVLSTQRASSLHRDDAALRFGRVSGTLVVIELALAVGLLGAGSVLGRGLLRFSFDEYHFDATRLVVSQLYFGQPPELAEAAATMRTLGDDERRAAWRRFTERTAASERELIGRLEAAGGVTVSRSSHFPGNDTPYGRASVDLGSSELALRSRVVEIDEKFFEAMGSAPARGRNFSRAEVDLGAKVAIVNTPFEQRFFGGGSALGRRVRVDDQPEWREIVGVVPDLALNPGAPSSMDGVYVPLPASNVVRFGIRTPRPERVALDLHAAAAGLAVAPQVQWTETMQEQMNSVQNSLRIFGSLLLLVGASALLLACAGIYAMVAFSVAQRRREIAIRMAIGASSSQIVRAIAGRTLVQLALGLAFGAGLAALALRLVAIIPTAIETGEPSMAVATIGVLTAAGLAALARPLRAAMAVRPTDWLREN